MQIVIDLPDTNITEDIIRAAKWEDGSLFDMALRGAIKNAIILPKGHGRLIDTDALEGHRQIQIVPCGNGKYVEVMTYCQNDIDVAPTIIGADKESEDKE